MWKYPVIWEIKWYKVIWSIALAQEVTDEIWYNGILVGL